MKKIIALLMVCCMLCTMAACTQTPSDNTSETPSTQETPNTSEDTTPDTPGDETPDESKPGDDTSDDTSDDTPAEPFNWDSITKEVALPTFKESTKQELVVCQKDGKDVVATVAVSPFQHDAYDLNAIKAQLKQNPLFQGWDFGMETTERGNVYLYDDIGQQTSYEYKHSIVATDTYYDNTGWFPTLNVDFEGSTQEVIGYKAIVFEAYLDVKNFTQADVDALYQAVHAVFGEYTDYLFYTPTGEYNVYMSTEIEQENGWIVLSRHIDNHEVAFTMQFSHNIYRTFDGFSGNGEYVPMLGTPDGLFDILNPEFGPCDMRDYTNIAGDFFQEHYVDFVKVTPDDGYTYRKLIADNGHEVTIFELSSEVSQKDLGRLGRLSFAIEYEFIKNNNGVTSQIVRIDIPLGVIGDHADYNAFKQQYFNKAVEVLELLFAGNQNVATNLQLSEDKTSEYDSYVEVQGEKYYFKYLYTCKETATDTYAAWVEADLVWEGPIES